MSSDSSKDFDDTISNTDSFDFDSSQDSLPSSSSSISTNISATSRSSSASSRSSRSAHSISQSGSSRSSSAASSIPPMENSDSSATEDYDMPDVNARNGDVIDLSSTQFLTQAPVDLEAEEADDDVVLIPQHIETIDLCSESLYDGGHSRLLLLQGNDVIEIEDSPAASRRDSIVMRPPRQSNRASPYEPPAAAHSRKILPKPRNLNLDDSQNDNGEPSQRVKITCPICLDSSMKKKLVSTKCGHIYCEDCLKLALQSLKKCPVCRKALGGRDPYHPIFFNGHM